MGKDDWLFVKSCILGDGCLTPIRKQGRNTISISFNHCKQQKTWLQAKGDRLNAIFERNHVVGERQQFDARTNKTYNTCYFKITSVKLLPLYEIAYPNGKKQFTKELLDGLDARHLAVLWADDGNLEPRARVGRLNLYDPEEQCNVTSSWIQSVCGAVGRYEDYEGNGFGRLRFPASEMIKIALAIKPYLHESMFYKINMQYKSSTKVKLLLLASSPNSELPLLDTLPETSELTAAQWWAIAKQVGVSAYKRGTKEELRQRIIENIKFISGR